MSKQDRQGARTVSDLEYRYGRRFSEIMGIAEESRKTAEAAEKAVEKLDSEEIFKRLTNDGACEGIYREDGDIYINASYIKSGELLADLIKAGVIRSIDGESVVIDLDAGTVDLTGSIKTESIATNQWTDEVEKCVVEVVPDRIGIRIYNEDGEEMMITRLARSGLTVQDYRGDVLRARVNPNSISLQNGGNYIEVTNYANDVPTIRIYSDVNNPLRIRSEGGVNSIEGLAAPTAANHAANKAYVDASFSACLPATESTTHPGCYFRTVDGATEWINPPLALGEEYRTTERFMGKPVYVKVLDFGALPNATQRSVAHGLSATAIVGLCAASTDGKYYFPCASSSAGIGAVDLYFNATNVTITTTANWSMVNAYVTVKYTKD